jgi:ribosome maturation factor RimP
VSWAELGTGRVQVEFGRIEDVPRGDEQDDEQDDEHDDDHDGGGQ